MFNGCTSLTSLDLSSFNTSNVTDMQYMFYGTDNLLTITTPKKMFVSRFLKIDLYRYFEDEAGNRYSALNKDTPTKITITRVETEIDDESSTTFKTGKEVNLTMKKLAGAPEDIDYLYSDENILSIEKATDEQYNNIKDNLTEDNIVSTSDSSKKIYMWYDAGIIYWYSEASLIYLNKDSSYMFSGCESLTSLDLSSFDTSNVTNMEGMFSGCSNLTSLDLSSFDTSNVTKMVQMFAGCESLTSLDISSFNTSKVTNMQYMFRNCGSLTSLDLSSFDMSNVKFLDNMLVGTDNMLTITTPKKMFVSGLKINLYGNFEDEAGNVYSVLNKDTPTKITIHR
jgi:surface protein